MSAIDPYAPPSAELHLEISDFQIFGEEIHTYSPLVLPDDLCVKCGVQGTDGVTKTKKLYWAPSWIAITILISWLITIILHYILRKQLDASFHLCPTCHGSRRKKFWGSVGGLALTFALLVVGVSTDSGPLLAIGGIGFIGALIAVFVFAMPAIRPKSHNNGLFVVKGADQAFLDAVQMREHDGSLGGAPQSATW